MGVILIILWEILIGLCCVLSLIFAVLTVNYSLKDSTEFKNKTKLVLTCLFFMAMFIGIGYYTYSYLEPLEVNSNTTSIENKSEPVELKSNQDISEIKVNKIGGEKAKYVECWPVKEEKEKTQVQTTNNNGKIIGDKDSKIYHVPGSRYYQKELQKLSNNEYFNTVEEAERAGYRAPNN